MLVNKKSRTVITFIFYVLYVEIMQTEDTSAELLDENSTLIHTPEFAMTVKQEEHCINSVPPSSVVKSLLSDVEASQRYATIF